MMGWLRCMGVMMLAGVYGSDGLAEVYGSDGLAEVYGSDGLAGVYEVITLLIVNSMYILCLIHIPVSIFSTCICL